MKISVKYQLSQEEIKRRIDNLLNKLMQAEFPAGVKIKDAKVQWNGNTMKFSFKAKKGLLGVTIEGQIILLQNEVVFDADIPKLVISFVSEDKIREVIKEEIEKLLK